MNFRRLEQFECVSRLGSFTKASEELMIAQPSITTNIKKLEEELEIILFVRDTRSVELTAEGEIFLGKVKEILKLVNKTQAEMMELKEQGAKILNVGIPPVIGGRLMSRLYKDFGIIYPDIHIKILEMGSFGVCSAIECGEIELGFVVLRDSFEEKFKVVPQIHDEIYVLMSRENSLARLDKIPVELLHGKSIVQTPTHSYVRKRVDEEFAIYNVEPKIVHTPDQMMTVFNLVAEDVGISFVLGKQIDTINERASLIMRPFEKAISFTAGWIWKKDKKLSYAARKCIEFSKANVFNK